MKFVLLAGAMLVLAGRQQAPAGPEPLVYSGIFRKGFEQSDFYPADPAACGPWWLTVESEYDHAQLETHARGEGRGRTIVVRMTVRGEMRGPVDFGFRPRFDDSLHVTAIVSVEPVSDEAFTAAVEAARACKRENS